MSPFGLCPPQSSSGGARECTDPGMVLSLCLLAVLRVLRANLYHLQVTPSTIV